jgi:hypothetical protein
MQRSVIAERENDKSLAHIVRCWIEGMFLRCSQHSLRQTLTRDPLQTQAYHRNVDY